MDLVARLAKTYTGVVHDVMRAMGLRDFTLPPEIRPLAPGQALAGVVATVSGKVDAAADPHETLLGWTGLLSKARADTVLICQPNDSTVAHMGELSAETLKLKGVRGYVADGGCRDVDFILKLGFPVWCRYFTPRDIVGYWLPDTLRPADHDRRGHDPPGRSRARRPRRHGDPAGGARRGDRRRGRDRDRHREPGAQGDPRRASTRSRPISNTASSEARYPKSLRH